MVKETGLATVAVAVDCERLVMAGGATMVNVSALELRLLALTTVIWALPADAIRAMGTVADMEVALV